MKTKQIMLATGLFIIMGFAAIAQKHSQKREKIEAHKIAFITQKLDLTPEEAQVFWPVYNQCRKQLEELRRNNRKDFKKDHAPLDEMSDKEVEEMVNNEIVIKQKELDLQKACLAQYKDVLPIKKVAKLYHAERQFKKELLKKMRDHREPQHKLGPR